MTMHAFARSVIALALAALAPSASRLTTTQSTDSHTYNCYVVEIEMRRIALQYFASIRRRHSLPRSGLIRHRRIPLLSGNRLGLLALGLAAALLTTAATAAPAMRPKAYYKPITEKNQSLCRTILASLNKEYSSTDLELNVMANPHAVGDFLLTTDLQVQWRRNQILRGTDAVDHAEIDFSGTGQRSVIYRSVGGYAHNRGDDSLIVWDRLASEFASDAPVSASIFEAMLKDGANELVPRVTTTPEWRRKKDTPGDEVFYYNAIEVGGRGFLLAAPSYPADSGILERQPASIDVYVLKYDSPKQMPMLCHFRHSVTAGKAN
ncbi:MAG TPA: hypothetical protein VMC10_23540 [Stellaceae bacterium]|nr:hypothetical protein [Stellaceae bacterium]